MICQRCRLPRCRPLLAVHAIVFAIIALFLARPLAAEVVRFEIHSREPFAAGQAFGEVGPYERIVGRVHYAVDPALPQNAPIVDLALAPRNAEGKVEFFADLDILAPRELARGNGAILYDVNNRGNKLALRFFNDAPGSNEPTDAGNGFLLREGYTIVWSGWDGELLAGDGRLRLFAPVAAEREAGGAARRPITGMVRYEIVPDRETTRLNVNRQNHGAYRPTESGLSTATLTWRLRPGDPRVPIAREQFRLHVAEPAAGEPAAGELPRVEIELPAGFRKGYLYELIYEARDPLAHGACFAAVRDLVAALKFGGGERNPLAGQKRPFRLAYGFGVSQSGRFLREFLYWGFNEDEQRRAVFDGLMPHVAGGGLGSFNHRFAQPTNHATQHDHHDSPTDRFPFAYERQEDPFTGRSDGILDRLAASGFAPKVFHSQSSAEYWTRSGSLVHTDPAGKRDARPPANVRLYAFGGTQHGPAPWPPTMGIGQTLANPGDYRPHLRALITAMDRWCRSDEAPPASIHPTIEGGTLVPLARQQSGFPVLPGVRYPEVIQAPPVLDFGPRWESHRIVDRQPPVIRGRYATLVPRCGPDGNELGCLLPPEVAVPLATHTGWSLRSAEAGAENELVSLVGSYIPFAATRAERERTGDPRPSLEERYGSAEQYLARLEAACRGQVRERYLLEEDVPRILARQKERAAERFAK